MSAADNSKRPIIIKRVMPHEDDHGGHWKIAYADFVTAMMAFFLVMWMLSSVSDKQRRGLARYFSATSIMDLRSGDGFMDGSRSALNGADSQMVPISSPSNDDGSTDADASHDTGVAPAATEAALAGAATAGPTTSGPATSGSTMSGPLISGPGVSGDDRMERQQMNAMKAEIDHMEREGELKAAAKNIQVDITPEGLRVQIFDRDGASMFTPGSAEPNRRLAAILDAIAPVLGSVRNSMIITGHTDPQPTGRAGYGNWELSSDRANGTRRYLEAHGIAGGRVAKVEGRASADPLLPQLPNDARNRRIELTLLRAGVAERMHSAGGTDAGG